jgi:hypothetical protein
MAVSRYPLAGLMRISMVLDDPDTESHRPSTSLLEE